MTHAKYFGVITNRDYIKKNKGTDKEVRTPFWDILDEHPDGWLCSLAYKTIAVPQDKQMIWDCGAWSYKLEEVPKLGKHLITTEWVIQEYSKYAKQGDFIIAPDHIFISDDVVIERRAFNKKSAEEFLAPALEAGFIPMGVVHGLDLDEKLKRCQELVDLGYKAISLGGLAFRASSQKKVAIEFVRQVRELFPDVWLHVLGLSAPSYVAEWNKIGVDSYDGASHYKQAFTGGAYYMYDNEQKKLLKYKAAKLTANEEVTAPLCECKACQVLREENIDTRTYGSNENNMGRAAHNMNHLIRNLNDLK
ncbi:hypothetical protein AB4160_18455 [Shewanella sp. 10N.286.51.B8]|uniref:hypothetical protein n=1 Tax=Shewanella sp. 10N.286.51.B8 TaxID=3229708 RepID=UPI00354DA133